MWPAVTIAILIILLILIFSTILFLNRFERTKDIYKSMPFTKVLLSDIYNSLKTGDLIFYRSSVSSIATDTIIPTPLYKHISMVIKKDDTLYSTESTMEDFYCKVNNESIFLKNGVSIVPLLPKLQYYCGMMFITQLAVPINEDKVYKLYEYINKLKNMSYPSLISLYLDFVLDIKISKSLYCYEYIYILLEYINIVNRQYLNSMDLSKFITTIHLQKLNNNSYSEVKQLVFDMF